MRPRKIQEGNRNPPSARGAALFDIKQNSNNVSSDQRIWKISLDRSRVAVKYLHITESAVWRFTILSTYQIESTFFHYFLSNFMEHHLHRNSLCSGYWTTPSIYLSILPSLLRIRIKVNESVPVTLLLSIVNSGARENRAIL